MIKFPFESKPLMIAAVVVLIGAPTAGATMRAEAPTRAPAEQVAGRLMQIELVAPKEPEVAATYPLETFAEAPVNEFKGRPPHGGAWRVSFGPDFPPMTMRALPAGDYREVLDEDAKLEQARFELARDDYVRAEKARAALLQAERERADREVQVYEERIFGRAPLESGSEQAEAEPAG